MHLFIRPAGPETVDAELKPENMALVHEAGNIAGIRLERHLQADERDNLGESMGRCKNIQVDDKL